MVVCPYLWCLVILTKSVKCFLAFVFIVLFVFNAGNFPQEMTKDFCSFQVSSLYGFRYLELRYFYWEEMQGKCYKISGINEIISSAPITLNPNFFSVEFVTFSNISC